MHENKTHIPEKQEDVSEKKTESGWGIMKGNSIDAMSLQTLGRKQQVEENTSYKAFASFSESDPEWKMITVDKTNQNHSNVYRISLELITEYNLKMTWMEVAQIIKEKNNLNNEFFVLDKTELQVPTLTYFNNHLPDKINQTDLSDSGQTARFELIKKKYFDIVDKGESHYIEAIKYLAETFNLDTSHAEMSYDGTITGAYAITEGNIGDNMIPIKFASGCFDKSEDFGIICRAVAHELMHTIQKSVDKMESHDEREFLAYYDTITRTDMPEIKDMLTLQMFITKSINYFNALPQDKKTLYQEKMNEILVIKTNKGL